MSDPVDKLTGMLMAAQLEIERLRAQVEELEKRAEFAERQWVVFEGETHRWQDRAGLAEAKVQDLSAVAQGAGNTVERLKAQVQSLLTTLTQDEFPDPAILHDDCRVETARLWNRLNSRTEEANRLELGNTTLRAQLAAANGNVAELMERLDRVGDHERGTS